MATKCQKCGHPTQDPTDLYCLPHQIEILEAQYQAGYLEPLTISTITGANQRLSPRKFLSLPDRILTISD